MAGSFAPIRRRKASPMPCIAYVFRLVLNQKLLGQNTELIIHPFLIFDLERK